MRPSTIDADKPPSETVLQPGGVIDPSDETLLVRFARGDRAALGQLARRYEQPILGMAMSLLGHREELAREAVQDTWVRVIGAAGHFGGRSSVKTWLYRIVINRCYDLRTKRRVEAERNVGAVGGGHRGEERSPCEPAFETGETGSHLREALEGLPGDRRLLLVLCYHAGMTHGQAAEVMGIPVGTLKSRLNAALDELRGVLAHHAHWEKP